MKSDIKRKKIVHLVTRDKFSSNYINFMKLRFSEYIHYFILRNRGFELQLVGYEHIIYTQAYWDIYENAEIRELLEMADKIIVSGFWGNARPFCNLPEHIVQKSYIHLWGGDFYCFRTPKEQLNLQEQELYDLKLNAFKRCAGLLLLLESECSEFVKITGIKNKMYVAPMPVDPKQMIDLPKYRHKDNHAIRFIVGNSATESNQHREVFELLKKYKDKNFVVYCPLSYGDEWYKEKVIEWGESILGSDHFVAISEYMSMDDYMSFLQTCCVGFFNNDRQQAMGNIRRMLAIGKKIYIRSDTSMWKHYSDLGYIVKDINSLNKENFEDVIFWSENDRLHNECIFDRIVSQDREYCYWKTFYNNEV